jgi:NADP-dependent 3-hydroxy acid dehydrogenase YdfG
MTSLTNNSVLVVGAGSGVGRATALLLASMNARVVAAGRQRSRLEQLQKEAGGKLELRALDATDASAVDALIGELQPDLIVLCAGTRARLAPVHEHTWESFSEPWQQDVKMAFEIGQAALRRPLRSGSCVIIVSSGAGLGGSPLSGGYAGAKRMQMFLAGYLQGVSNDRGLGIRFVAVVPKQLIEGTQTAEVVSSAYATRAGTSREKFMERFGAPLSTDGVAQAILGVARGELAEGATILGVTGKGTEIL